VDDAALVAMVNRVAHDCEEDQPLINAQIVLVSIIQEIRRTLQKLHRVPGGLPYPGNTFHASLENLGDVRMAQAREGICLHAKTLCLFGGGRPGSQDLEGDLPPWVVLLCQIHGSHPPRPEHFEDAIGTKAATDKVLSERPPEHPIEGFAASDCIPLTGDHLAARVTWKGRPDLARLSGTAVKLRFVLNNADLFSMRFQ